MPSTFRMIFAALAIMLPLAACSSQGGNLPMLETSQVDDTTYRLGAGDKLHVVVAGADDLSNDYIVGDNGAVSLPLVGDIKAGGLTRAQVEHEMEVKLGQGFIKNPKVSVSVLSYRPFYIYGEVTKPGEYPYASGMRVTSAIATAGGYTYRAQEGYVVVTRDGQDRRALPGMPIRPDDIIRVPERYF
ncbi:MAG: polysaccharide biosynthesis/export family protein [Stellaceae bacterium]